MISVIVPNYNHSRFLLQRLQSIKEQSFGNFECLVLDDNSSDNSREIILEFIKNDHRFREIFNAVNSGSTFAQWNKGIRNASGEYIWIAESDDMADISLLENLLAQFDTDPEIVLAYCQSYRTDTAGNSKETWKTYTDDLDSDLFDKNFVMDGKEYIDRLLIHRNTIPNASAVIFRKHIYEQAGGASEQLKNNGDWLTWLKMLSYGKIAYVARPLNYFRYHDNSVIATLRQQSNTNIYKEQYDGKMRKEFADFVKKSGIALSSKTLYINEQYIAADRGNEGLFYLKRKKYLKAWKYILQASVKPRLQSGFIKRAISER